MRRYHVTLDVRVFALIEEENPEAAREVAMRGLICDTKVKIPGFIGMDIGCEDSSILDATDWETGPPDVTNPR